MINVLFCSSTSACFETETGNTYYSGQKFTAYLNGKAAGEFDTNVFSLFNLIPDTVYKLTTSLSSIETVFRTHSETACINVRLYGAVGDGKTDDSMAVQSAINVCPPQGRVYFPKGVYTVAPLTLKSDITVELADGAILSAVTDVSKFPVIRNQIDCKGGFECELATWEGLPADCYQSILSLHFLKNVNIIGQGLIDGNAQKGVWWIKPKEQKIGRPRLMFANRCENINVHGVSCQNSPSWNYHPYFCKNVAFYDTRVNADKDSPNTDGIDPEACTGVKIIGVRFSVGDDCIAIKSGKMAIGAKYKTPCSDITIRNCFMKDGHGAVVLGSEMSGGVKNLTVTKCLFSDTDRGLRIKTRRGRGKYACIDGVEFSDIIMRDVKTPLVINMFYFCDPDGKTEYVWSKKKLPVDDGTPKLGEFVFRNIDCEGVHHACGFFYGLPEQPIAKIVLDNIKFKIHPDATAGTPAMMTDALVCRKMGIYANNVACLELKNTVFEGVEGDNLINMKDS